MSEGERRLRDSHGRHIEYLRVSITEHCDYRCVFCMPPGDCVGTTAPPPLGVAETLRLCRIFADLGVDSFKVTGGEPFMNPDATRIMAGLKDGCAARSVTVTTNASTLDRYAADLVRIGVDCVNVSVNAIDPGRYAAVTGGGTGIGRIIDNILLARNHGLAVKLNVVPIHGLNDMDLVPILEFALGHGITVRFIELMPLGEGRRFRGLTRSEVQEVVERRFGPMTPSPGRFGNGPAAYATVRGYAARIGYIAALSRNFCADCNRIRLTSAGFLKTCLHHDHGVDLAAPLRAGQHDGDLAARIRAVVAGKPERHRFGACPATSESGGEPMHRIGG